MSNPRILWAEGADETLRQAIRRALFELDLTHVDPRTGKAHWPTWSDISPERGRQLELRSEEIAAAVREGREAPPWRPS